MGIFPLVISFNTMPNTDGNTIIRNKSTISESESTAMVSPTAICNKVGTIIGESNVSIKIIDKHNGRFPLQILTQITLVTPIGTATDKIKPIVSK